MKTSTAFISMIILTIAITSYAYNVVTSLSEPIWKRKFGDASYAYQNKAVAFSPKVYALFIAGINSTSGKGIPTKVEGIWIWKISDAGEKVTDLRIKSTEAMKFVDVEALAILDTEDVFVIAKLVSGQSILIKLNAKGEILFSKKINDGRISKIIPTIDNKLLLIGHQSLDSFLIKIDTSGEVLWSKAYDRGQTEMLVDGIATDDGGFVLIENSGKVEQFFMGSSQIWLTKYDATGQNKFEKSFPGRYGSITKGKTGSYAIVYDKSGTANQDIWIKAVDQQFSSLWDVKVTETNFGLERFKITSMTNGDFVVAGPINGRPWVSYITSSGAKKWDFSGKTMDMAVGTDFVSKDNYGFIVSSVVAVNEQYKLINKIRVIKFQPE